METKNTPSFERSKVAVIIPSVLRNELLRAVDSIRTTAIPLIITGGSASENRNKGLQICRTLEVSWVVFLDDDDWLAEGWEQQLDDSFEIIVFRMLQGHTRVIPEYGKQVLGQSNRSQAPRQTIGINYALNMNLIT